MFSRRKNAVILLSLSLVLLAGGCKKKAPAPPPPPPPKQETPPPPPPPKAPTINNFSAEPSSIERGQSSTLRWSVSDATDIRIEPGLGSVTASGNRTVFPGNTTSYTLTARGPGDERTASATVTVTAPPAPPPKVEQPKATLSERIARDIQDAFFDYDKSDVRDDARQTLTRNAEALKAIFRDFPTATIVVEGHCDERGSAEYNLGLGDRRSTAAKEFLGQLGVPADRLKTISYGKERPQCTEDNESCWQRNRRAHFAAAQ